jgi:hypothetical protein
LGHATIVHSRPFAMTWGKSPLPPGMARWDLFGFGVSAFAAACYVLTHPEKSVALMFWADTGKLKDKTTVRLWALEVRAFALGIMLLSLLSVLTFIRTLHR